MMKMTEEQKQQKYSEILALLEYISGAAAISLAEDNQGTLTNFTAYDILKLIVQEMPEVIEVIEEFKELAPAIEDAKLELTKSNFSNVIELDEKVKNNKH